MPCLSRHRARRGGRYRRRAPHAHRCQCGQLRQRDHPLDRAGSPRKASPCLRNATRSASCPRGCASQSASGPTPRRSPPPAVRSRPNAGDPARRDPLAARRVDVEQCVRWLQEVRRLQPSTVSRRFSVVAGFYRTCVIDGVREHSPADHVRGPPCLKGASLCQGRSLGQSRRRGAGCGRRRRRVGVQAAQCFVVALAGLAFAPVVGAAIGVAADLGDRDDVQGAVGLAVTGARQPVAYHVAGGDLDRATPAKDAKCAAEGNRLLIPARASTVAATMSPTPAGWAPCHRAYPPLRRRHAPALPGRRRRRRADGRWLPGMIAQPEACRRESGDARGRRRGTRTLVE